MDKKEKILVIEDEEKVRHVVVSILEEEGFDVYASADGKTGIKLAKELKPLVVICDIMLPDIDGYEICSRLRAGKETANVIFIFLTAKVDTADFRKGMTAGADDYVFKPFKANELVDAVSARIDKYKALHNINKEESKDLTPESNIFVNQKGNTKLIKVADISAVSAEGVYSYVWTSDGTKNLVRKSMNEWEEALPSNTFIRIHRSYIVNQNRIEKIEPWFKHSFVVKLKGIDENFYISERYASKLRKRFSF